MKKELNNKKNKEIIFDLNLLKKNWILVLCFLIFIVFFVQNFNLLSELSSLPGPLYGGDIYMYEGMLNHHYKGGSFFESSQFYGEYTHLPQAYFLFGSLFAKIFGLSPLSAGIFYPLFTMLVFLAITFWFGLKFFKDKNLAALFSLFFLTLFQPSLSPTKFNIFIGIPLIYLSYFYYKDEKKYWISGIILGISSLIEISSFMHLNILLVLLFLYEVIFNKFSFKNKILIFRKKEIPKDFKLNIIRFLKIYLVALPFMMMFFGPIIFYYKFNVLNPFQNFVLREITMANVFNNFLNSFKSLFFVFNTVRNFIFSLLSLVSIIYLIKSKFENKKLILFIMLVAAIGLLHPLITIPLFNTSLAYWSFSYSFTFLKTILVFLGFNYLFSFLKKDYKMAVYLFFLVFIVFSFNLNFSNYSENQWVSQAKNPQTEVYSLLADSLNNYLFVDDVVLTLHPESGFALNALTGSKVVNYRRTHANVFVDQDERIADSAIMLFSNNSELISELRKKYSVDYLFIDAYAVQNVNGCLQNWDSFESNPDASYACLTVSLDYREYLESNGLETKMVNVRLDPASVDAPRFDMLIIKPKTFIYGLDTSQVLTLGNGLDEVYGLVKIN